MDDEKPQDLTTSATSISSVPTSVFSEEKLMRHMRKSSNPVKRRWGSSVGLNSMCINPTTGKKRVQCQACLKTFCDKGALKIHFSAVHLREMHKCTVEGCTMMFSSRRSRNRHSANPNPKLHMAGVRRKSHAHSSQINLANSPTPSGDSYPPTMVPSAYHMDKGLDLSRSSSRGSLDNDCNMEGIYQDEHSHDSSKDDDDEDAELPVSSSASSLLVKWEGRASRKRKSMTPTRCAQMNEMYDMSDDGSSGMDEDSDDNQPQIKQEDHDTDENSNAEKAEVPMQGDTKLDANKMETNEQTGDNAVAKEDNKKQEDALSFLGVNRLRTESDRENEKPNEENGKIADEQIRESFSGLQNKVLQQMETLLTERMKDISANSLPNTEAALNSRLAAVLAGERPTMIEGNGEHVSKSSHYAGDASDHESNYSHSSGESQSPPQTRSSDGYMNVDVPMDPENPRRCIACGKIFQNYFGVKTHYQNVHLKVMHTCTVDGCNASFPSKRSRDRHSSNLNLHRKLLSTHIDKDEEKDNNTQLLRDEFLSKIYDSQFHGDLYKQFEENNKNGSDGEDKSETPPLEEEDEEEEEEDEDATNHNNSNHTHVEQDTMSDGPQSEINGTVKCHVCLKSFRDNLILKEHFETVHPKEMYHCTIGGCDKIFSTRKSRNRHSQNDSLHKHIGVNGTSSP